jgi:hypothetical protein
MIYKVFLGIVPPRIYTSLLYMSLFNDDPNFNFLGHDLYILNAGPRAKYFIIIYLMIWSIYLTRKGI